jgi:ribosomal protein S12 methylthiotransferase accessory factor
MWTQALLLGANESILIPAESVYFPFLPREYNTRPSFVSTSNGVAAGSTYLEAVIHALYELIERHYYGLWEFGKIRAHALISEELDTVPNIRRFRNAACNEFLIEILALRVIGLKNLPMFICWLVRPDGAWFYGSGCAPNFDMAIHRAMSEAFQAYSVLASGTREDGATTTQITSLRNFPCTQTLTRRAYSKTAHDKYFTDLQSELKFLTSWLESAGFPIITIANLSRHGLDLPVVKAAVPGLCARVKRCYGLGYTMSDIHAERFHFNKARR